MIEFPAGILRKIRNRTIVAKKKTTIDGLSDLGLATHILGIITNTILEILEFPLTKEADPIHTTITGHNRTEVRMIDSQRGRIDLDLGRPRTTDIKTTDHTATDRTPHQPNDPDQTIRSR